MDWNSNALWVIIGLIGGIIVSSFFYIISIKRKSITYEILTTPLISNKVSKIKDLSILYKDKQINDLYVSKINIINTGNTIIERNDFSPSDPLLICTNGIFLIYLEDDSNYIPMEHNKINVINDYFPKNCYWDFTIFHTGDVYVSGTLKDGKIKRYYNNRKNKTP